MDRRSFISVAAALSLSAAAALPAQAQTANYPSKPVTIVVPYAPGGATDVIARLVGERLSALWKQTVIIDNRPGAGTVVGAGFVSKAPGDGYTLYMTTAAHTISKSLYKRLPYDPIADFAPVGLAAVIPVVLAVGPGVKEQDLAGVLKKMRAEPGMTYGSPGNGSPQHLAGALFRSKGNVDLTHVPYRGDAPMLTDLMGGQLQTSFVTLSAVLPHLKTGKLRAVAVAHNRRADPIPNVPTFAEAGFGDFQAATWFGLFAPSSVPAPLLDKISKDMAKVVAEPEMKAKLEDMGGDVVNLGPKEFADFIKTEVANWSEAVRLSGAQID